MNIKTPIWKTNSIGVSEEHLGEEIFIDYKTKDGNYLYPSVFFVSKEKGMTYPVKYVIKNHRIHEIPIKDLEVIRMRGIGI